MHVCMHACMQTDRQTYIHTYIHIYIYVYLDPPKPIKIVGWHLKPRVLKRKPVFLISTNFTTMSRDALIFLVLTSSKGFQPTF